MHFPLKKRKGKKALKKIGEKKMSDSIQGQGDFALRQNKRKEGDIFYKKVLLFREFLELKCRKKGKTNSRASVRGKKERKGGIGVGVSKLHFLMIPELLFCALPSRLDSFLALQKKKP